MREDKTRTDVRNAFAYMELTQENMYQCPVCGTRDGRITGTEAGRRWTEEGFHRHVDILIQCNSCEAVQRVVICEKISRGQVVIEMEEEQ